MDLARFLQIYVIQGCFALFFFYMAIVVLRRGKKKTNLYLSSFYLFTAIGGLINIIYANIFVENIVYILHFITYFVLCYSLIFLLIFTLILIKPGDTFKTKSQVILLILAGILLLGLLLIPNGIQINQTTNWKPNWSWSFFLYSVLVCSVIIIVPTSYYSIKIYSKFENQHLKKKWKYYLLGMLAYFFLYYGTSFSNTLNNDSFRLIWSILSLPTLISLYLIYYGVGRQLE
ncbi:MAG: hypothetical protein KGD65_12805 [Candidatus Lokiarchaeota archaeon]|nr:hypothetical protein [Candidatus Lokiarchaeota archaeon]